MKKLRFLQKFLKISRIFRENLRTNQNYAVVGGFGRQRKFQKFLLKTNEKLQF